MTKQRKRKSKPVTLLMDADLLAEQMEAAATIVWTVSDMMEYFAGFDPKTRDRPLRVAAMSVFLRTWASDVREQANKQKGGGK
jgi:hypothetical protein